VNTNWPNQGVKSSSQASGKSASPGKGAHRAGQN